jgi:hypothetical protein
MAVHRNTDSHEQEQGKNDGQCHEHGCHIEDTFHATTVNATLAGRAGFKPRNAHDFGALDNVRIMGSHSTISHS